MSMNVVIQEKRRALGLTQEQVAGYLNVSIPAVSKWEKGTTNPDISLLAPLARLLKTDLNTLFCFREDMTEQEIGLFCKEISEIVQTKGISEGFATAEKKIHAYPHNETLLHYLTFQLDGLLAMSGSTSEEMRTYDEKILSWYHRLSESNDIKIKNSADYMIVSRLIRKGNYDQAQEVLDRMPDSEDIASSMADKLMLQVIIYQEQGKAEKASRALQNALLMALNKVQILLCKMVDAELAAGEIEIAEKIADRASQMPELFDLWDHNSFVAPLQIAVAKQDADKCICLLRKMLAAMLIPWDMGSSPLFHRIAKDTEVSDMKQMLSAILCEMERKNDGYSFLQDRDAFKELISEYRELIKK